MVKLNHHYFKLTKNYLFSDIEKKVQIFKENTPDHNLIHFGIGDIVQPLSSTLVAALEEASKEMGHAQSFRGYGPSQGFAFLREAIAQNDYENLDISPDEIFISNGAKNDLGNIQEIFAMENRIAIPNPTYPVYIDTNVMAGRTRLPLKNGSFGGVTYLPCNETNHFLPEIPNRPSDLIYLCSPNNPTGVAMDKKTLQKWVQYAKKMGAILIFDGAYEAFIRTPNCPRSIYEVEGAKEVAIEIRSFSKTAGFTGLRCSYTVVPKALKVNDGGKLQSLHEFWKRRHETKYGGTPYLIQKAAAAIYTPIGKEEIKARIDEYLSRAKMLKIGLEKRGYKVYGGIDSPYLWVKTPPNTTSWEFFDFLLEKKQIVVVPGCGFGTEGEGFVRLSILGAPENVTNGLKRL